MPQINMSDIQLLRPTLEAYGWCIVRDVFCNSEVEQAQKAVYDVSSSPNVHGFTYGQPFNRVSEVFHSNINIEQILQSALDSQRLVFFGDVVLRTDTNVGFKFHKDNIVRFSRSKEFLSPVPVVRCGWYLADHRKCSGGIAFQTGSHQKPGVWGGGVAADSTERDLVVWFTTTTHAANFQRIGLGNYVLPSSPPVSKLLSMIPKSWLEKKVFNRVAYLPTFGAPSQYLWDFLAYIADREDYVEFTNIVARGHSPTFEGLLNSDLWDIVFPRGSEAPHFKRHWEDLGEKPPSYAVALKN